MPDLVDQIVAEEAGTSDARRRVASGKGDLVDQVLAGGDDQPTSQPNIGRAWGIRPPAKQKEIEPNGAELGPYAGLKKAIADPLIGAAKGLGSTVYGAGELASKIPGVPHLAELFGADPELARFEGGKPEELEPSNTGQRIGFVGEQIAESFLPGGLVDDAVRATKGQSTARRIGDAMWREAASSAGTSMVQTGGDVGASMLAGVTGGLMRGAVSVPSFLRDDKLAAEVLKEAKEWGIPLTKAEQTQGSIRKFVDFLVSRSIGGSKRMAEFKLERNQMLEEMANRFVDDLDGAPMEPRAMGQYVQSLIDQVDAAAGAKLSAASDEIISAAGDVKLDLGKLTDAGKYEPSPLVMGVRELIEKNKMEDVAEWVGSNKDLSVLRQFAYPVKEVVDPIAAAIDPDAAIEKSVRQMDLATARKLRTALFNMTADRELSIDRAAVERLRGMLNKEIEVTLGREGLDDLAAAFKEATQEYADTKTILESKVIERLSKKGGTSGKEQTISPETIAEVLWGTESETTIAQLKKFTKPDDLRKVQASMLQQVMGPRAAGGTQHPKGFFDIENFKNQIEAMDGGKGAALFGPDLYKELRSFANAAERYKITGLVKDTARGDALPLLAQLRLSAVMGLGPGVATGIGAGMITGDMSTGLKVGAATTAVGLGLAGAEALTTWRLAKMLTNPKITHDLAKAMTADPMSTMGKQLAARISAYIAKTVKEESQEREREAATRTRQGDSRAMNKWLLGQDDQPASVIPPVPKI